jgi:O-antigen ligase
MKAPPPGVAEKDSSGLSDRACALLLTAHLALLGWAMLTLGGAGRWASATITAAAFALGGATLWATRRAGTGRRAAGGMLAGCLGAAALWFLAQSLLGISLDPSLSRETLLRWSALVFQAAALSRLIRTERRLAWLCAGICLLGSLQALAGFLVPPSGGYFYALYRFRGTFSGPNAFAGFLAMTLCISMGLCLRAGGRLLREAPEPGALFQVRSPAFWRQTIAAIVLVGATALQGIALLLSGSRGGITAGALGSGALLLGLALRSRHALPKPVIGLTAALAAAAVAAALSRAPELAHRRVEQTVDAVAETASDVSLSGRLAIWEACLDLIPSRPLGVGLGCFQLGLLPVHPDSFGDRRIYHAHCDLLEGLVEAGWFGFVPIGIGLVILAGLVRRALGPTGWAAERAGLAAALLAAGVHALVDFNLSSRPAVTLLALMAAAVVAGWPPPAASGRISKPALGALLILSLAGSLLALDTAWAAWRMEAIRTRVGLAPDPYFWARPNPSPHQNLIDELEAVTRHRPRDAWLHYLAGRSLVERVNPDFQDAGELYERAAGWLIRSLDHAPARPEAAAILGAVRARQAVLDEEALSDSERVRDWLWVAARHLESAARRAPIDHLVAAMTCDGWFAVLRGAQTLQEVDDDLVELARASLIDRGRTALSNGGLYSKYVIGLWVAADIKATEIGEAADLPLGLWPTWYQAVKDQADPGEIIRLLGWWEQALRDKPLGDAPNAFARRARAVDQWLTEQCRWDLALGRWDDYRKRQQRLDLRHRQKVAAEMDAPGLSRAGAGLRAREMLSNGGPTLPLQLAVAEFEYRQGRDVQARRLVLQAAMSGPWDTDDLAAAERFLSQAAWTDDRQALGWLETRIALEEGEGPPIDKASVHALPLSLRHRGYLAGVRTRLQQGRRDQAMAWLDAAREACPTDLMVLESMLREGRTADGLCQAYAELRLPIGLGMQFLAGSVRLEGIDLVDQDGIHLRMAWQFLDQVPADLTIGVSLQEAEDVEVFRRRIRLTESHGQAFRTGRPVTGTTIPVSVPLPRGQPGQTLFIGLLGGGKGWLRSREGLPGLVVQDWDQYVRRPVPPGEELRVVASRADPVSGLDLDLLGPDGYLLRSDGSAVTVCALGAAGLRRGMAAAEDVVLGRRQYLPDSVFRINPSIPAAVAPLWLVDRPAFRWRAISRISRSESGEDQTWAAVHGMGPIARSDRQRIRHALGTVFSPEIWYADHPQWYPERRGQRAKPTDTTWQPCLTADGLVDHAVEEARRAFDEEPDRTHFSLAINDGTDWCECSDCRESVAPDQQDVPASKRWWTEPYWGFVRAVAEPIAVSHPGRTISALAYANVLLPPEAPLPSNVEVWVCLDSGGFFDPAYREMYLNTLRVWTACTPRAALYGYQELATWVYPRYRPTGLKSLLETAYELGVQDVYLEGPHVRWTNGPLLWITAGLLWDPSLNVTALQSDFCDSLFGAAADPMNGYFDALSEQWASAPQGAYFEGFKDVAVQARRYPEPVLTRLSGEIDEALQAAPSPLVRRRIERISHPLPLLGLLSREVRLTEVLRSQDPSGAAQAAARSELIGIRRWRDDWLDRAYIDPSLISTLRTKGTLSAWDERVAAALTQSIERSGDPHPDSIPPTQPPPSLVEAPPSGTQGGG